jgi:SAM-dependent methyltransferase
VQIDLIRRLNRLWQPVYPYLAEWIGPWSPQGTGLMLELGPFSGGISAAMLKCKPNLRALCLPDQEKVARWLSTAFDARLAMVCSRLDQLPFSGDFDLVVFRGAFFFLNPTIIAESYRILKPGGRALLGGGYGPLTPVGEIASIAVESKMLNYRLGKQLLSRRALGLMVAAAGLDVGVTVFETGGLWVLLEKPDPKIPPDAARAR